MIGIVDYGIGNINAFYNIYKEKNINLKIISNTEDLNQNIKINIMSQDSLNFMKVSGC